MPDPIQSPHPTDLPSASQTPHLEIDITAHLCPMTFVRTRLALDRIAPGQVLAVRLRGEEPRNNIPKTAIEQGHTILSQNDGEDGITVLLIRKGAAPGSRSS
jgi:TusA-related sulfurtransferase